MHIRLFAAVALATWLAVGAGAAVVYVDANAPGPVHNGASWSNAFKTISAGIDSVAYGGDVWIKSGTYRETVRAKSYVNLYGGFLGHESSPSQRIIGAFPTVIDAGWGGAVVTVPIEAWIVLDGLTVRHGLANNGGGIFCDKSSNVNIRNCRIENCRALTTGGGVYYGKYTLGEMTDCVITGCSAPNGGGGVVEYHSYPTWQRIVIAGNTATQGGGGLYCPGHSGAYLANCTLVGNTAGATGGAAHALAEGTSTFDYCIISGNSAPSGGGLYGEGIGAMPIFSHCDFWQNANGDWAGSILPPSQMAANFFADPLFVRPDSDEYHLLSGSPCAGVGAYPLEPVCPIERIGVAKSLEDGVQVRLAGKIVSGTDGDITYIQEPDRAGAVAAAGLTGCAQGDVIASVSGTISTDPNGARVLEASSGSSPIRGAYQPKPLAVRPSWLESATGLYVRTWGSVTEVFDGGFTISDGSVSATVRWSGPSVSLGSYVGVTGIHAIDEEFAAVDIRIM